MMIIFVLCKFGPLNSIKFNETNFSCKIAIKMADHLENMDFSKMSASQKENVFDNVKLQIAAANAEMLLTSMSDKCMKKCLLKPGTSLDSSDQKCLSHCVDRFLDSYNIVWKTYQDRIQHN